MLEKSYGQERISKNRDGNDKYKRNYVYAIIINIFFFYFVHSNFFFHRFHHLFISLKFIVFNVIYNFLFCFFPVSLAWAVSMHCKRCMYVPVSTQSHSNTNTNTQTYTSDRYVHFDIRV